MSFKCWKDGAKVSTLLITAATLLLAGCCVRPPGPSIIYIPPDPGPEGISIIVVRASQWGSHPIHYVALDGRYVAVLRPGQYTKIPISKGTHHLAVTGYMFEGGLGVMGPGMSRESLERAQRAHTASFYFECSLDNACFFGTKWIFSWTDTPGLSRIDTLDGEFSLEGKTFVKPGPATE